MVRFCLLATLFLVLFSGCIAEDGAKNTPSSNQEAARSFTSSPTASITSPNPTERPVVTSTIQPAAEVPNITHVSLYENRSAIVEVNYREYVDWFRNHNLNIRAYTSQEYVCGQYTVDMINDSEKAGYKAYFAAVKFSDDTGHALVSFRSTVLGYTSWYFFEPQTNNLMTPEKLAQELNRNIGKKVTEVNIYGYFDDAGDKDPTSWRFAFPLYNKKY